ncbi:hypothetical protein ORI89_19215 [Sphingobacterium sp. UT-1RO-CII-1]|uniref:hypothetical protein n=1 Tax=Sphingobacterium sp. UT-1RO-CII-1 TaxID=2995225 RepID=UPI00227BD0EA|nr:hypothetical protein [Sphingobacterium sp. UT-1RO-CII-1]MCY4781784.1 hypothetical protein [Sphingobacterium sp. UT-1RO-CII-1]
MASVFIKVPVSERLPKKGGSYGVIVNDSLFSHADFYYSIFTDEDEWSKNNVTHWLEEIELPEEEAARQFANEMAGDGHYNMSEIDAFVDGFNYLYEDLKGGLK